MLNKSEILEFLKENKTLLFEDYHITKIGVFGSYARGEQTDNSDIDILVEFADGTENLFEIKRDLKGFIGGSFNKQVDICREKYIKPIFREYILKDAVYA